MLDGTTMHKEQKANTQFLGNRTSLGTGCHIQVLKGNNVTRDVETWIKLYKCPSKVTILRLPQNSYATWPRAQNYYFPGKYEWSPIWAFKLLSSHDMGAELFI